MALEIKIECGVGAESAAISKLLPALAGMAYEIRVPAPVPSVTANAGVKRVTVEKNGQASTKQRIEKKAPKPRPPGKIKLAVLQAHSANATAYHSSQAIQEATGLTADQVRSATADAVSRDELARRTVGDEHAHKITDHGLQRIKDGAKN